MYAFGDTSTHGKKSKIKERCKQEKKLQKNKEELFILAQLYLKESKKIKKKF